MNSHEFAVSTTPYSTAAFNALPEFSESKARYEEKKHALIRFGEIIRLHGAEKHLGAALIHKHFPLNPGEIVVEKIEPHGSLLSPETKPNESILTPYLWHLGKARLSKSFEWRPVEYVRSSDIPDEVREFSLYFLKQPKFLHDLAMVLAEAQAENTFGLALLHRQRIRFNRDNQILLESPGQNDRSLVVSAVDAVRTTDEDYTQTYWHFDIGGEALAAGCEGHGCAGYCSQHSE